jgi:hypothetical protein
MWRRICWRKSSGVGEPEGLGVRRLSALALIGVRRVRDDGLAGLSEPPDDGDAPIPGSIATISPPFGAALREAGCLRRQCREHRRSDPGWSGGRRAMILAEKARHAAAQSETNCTISSARSV